MVTFAISPNKVFATFFGGFANEVNQFLVIVPFMKPKMVSVPMGAKGDSGNVANGMDTYTPTV